jgi:MFS transporter, DHA2 family, multidrug resistance protein
MTADANPTPPRAAINPWAITFTVMLATFMEILDTSVANVALPHIAGNLSATVDESTWVLTAYLVANAIILPLSGWFSMLFGRKRFYIVCVTLFTVSSLLCGLAPSLGLLIFFRILQGIGGGALQPISQSILVESFPKEKQGMAMAAYGFGVVVAPVIGPTLGGWITDNYTWRWIFLINIPVGVLSVLLTTLLVFDPPHLPRRTFATGLKLDYIGLGLLATGLAALEIMLDEGQRNDWFGSNMIVTATILAAVCLVGVVFWELHTDQPVIDLRVLKDRNFALSTATMYAVGFALYGSTVILPIFLQTILGYTATLSGLALSPGGIATMIAMPIVGRLLFLKFPPRWLVVGGLLISSTAMFRMAGFNLDVDFRTVVLARTIQMLGLAFLFVPINATAFPNLPKEQLGAATGLMNLARNIGGSAGIAAMTTILARRSQFHQQVLVTHLTPSDTNYMETLRRAAAGLTAQGASAVDAAHQAQGVVYGMVQRQAAMLSVVDAFWVLAWVFLALLPIVMLMKRPKPSEGPIVME